MQDRVKLRPGGTHAGQRLENRPRVATGDSLHIPADMPHPPVNPGPGIACAVTTRSDPQEQESVILPAESEALVR